jgi:hypothetical protein
VGAVILGAPWLLVLVLLVLGGRFQRNRGSEIDMLVLAIVYPLGPAVAGALLGLCMPLLRRPWTAVVAGMIAGIPWFALMSLAFDPHGPHPYSVDWPVTIFLAVCLGPVAGAFAHDLIPVMRKRRERSSRRVG